MKKKLAINLILLLIGFASFAQDTTTTFTLLKRKAPYYTVSGGILGAANFSKFRFSGNNSDDFKYKWGVGYSGGVWLNFPFGNVVSLEVQGEYSSYRLKPKDDDGSLFDGKMTYISVPVFLKFHLGHAVAITVGPQFDFLTKVDDDNNNLEKGDFKKSSIALDGGIEIFPHGRVTIFGRYVHGLDNLDKASSSQSIKVYNQGIQAGLKLKLFGKRVVPPVPDSDGDTVNDDLDKCPLQPGTAKYQGCPIPDTDNDGINDEVDKCPTVPGLVKYQGCPIPDTDGDGINDELDKCPTVAGTAKYQGCPVPDTDGDGINDDLDKCPTVAGTAKYQGCPVPDTDGDGINDELDKCPTVPGVKENDGCPAIPKFNAATIQFLTGSAKLTSGALSELNDLVTYMKEYPQMSLQVNGHTDNVGKEATNQKLSEQRAEAVVAALVKKGIDASRMNAAGFGMTQPVEDNATALGRTRNRRVEFKFSQLAGSQ